MATTLAALEKQVEAQQRELDEHKRLCEVHKREVYALKQELADLKIEVTKSNAETRPWIHVLERIAMWIGFAMLTTIAIKLGLKQ